MPTLIKPTACQLKTIVIVLWLAFTMASSPLSAAELYTATIPLVEDSEAGLQQAKTQAMALMITRLTGQAASLNSKQVQVALKEPDSYISQISRETDSLTQQVMLKFGFDKVPVQQLLDRSQLPIWASGRANVLVWLVIEQQGIQEIIADGYEPIGDQLLDEAAQRGLPIILPLMDLTDQLVIGPGDVWGDFQAPIKIASQRYQPHGMLLGRIFRNSDELWQGQGRITLSEKNIEWKLAAQSQAQLMTIIVENLGQELGQRFALITDVNGPKQSLLHVSGVKNIAAYAQLQRALLEVANISDVALESLHAEQLLISVFHQGSVENLLISLGLQSQLYILDDQVQTPYSASNPILAYYQWR